MERPLPAILTPTVQQTSPASLPTVRAFTRDEKHTQLNRSQTDVRSYPRPDPRQDSGTPTFQT